ncbi:hypothetical protein [Methylobacterium sp. JK268]
MSHREPKTPSGLIRPVTHPRRFGSRWDAVLCGVAAGLAERLPPAPGPEAASPEGAPARTARPKVGLAE